MFIKTKEYDEIKEFLDTDMFLNVYVSGPKGCGKTKTILQVHEDIGKPIIRTNITIESDEDSLMGNIRLKDGNTFFEKGPVLRAMEQGSTLLLDEIDLGSSQRLMCIQSVLEGNAYHIKKNNELVEPKQGFKIIATANTKGSGDDSGQYVGAQFLNAAFKDRFSIFYDFDYYSKEVEKKILQEIAKDNNVSIIESDIDDLIMWSDKIRNSKDNIFNDETISTRKLIDIVKTFKLTKDIKKAIKYAISGLPKDYVESFLQAYELMHAEEIAPVASQKKIFTF